jgi:carbonic anhydrase/acetyltransferase-like protein (isoleucine patch superfamily)
MMIMDGPTLIPFGGKTPRIDDSAFIAPGAKLIGDIEIGPEASIWYNVVLRGDLNRIRIGARSNVQDGSVLHVDSPKPGGDAGHPTMIGEEVLIGHLAMVHGCILHDRSFVGLGAIVMDGCEIESGGMLAAGGLLTPGRRILAGQLWAGRPAKYVRDLSPEEQAGNLAGVFHYVKLAKLHHAALIEQADKNRSAHPE